MSTALGQRMSPQQPHPTAGSRGKSTQKLNLLVSLCFLVDAPAPNHTESPVARHTEVNKCIFEHFQELA